MQCIKNCKNNDIKDGIINMEIPSGYTKLNDTLTLKGHLSW